LLHFTDRLRHLDFAWAGIGAVKDGMAAVNAELVVKNLQAFGSSPVSAIIDKTVGGYNRCRAYILVVGPERRAGGGAGGAQDALGGVIEALACLG